MVALVRKLTSCAGRPDGILRPTEENRDLGDVERMRSVLEHLWNTERCARLGIVGDGAPPQAVGYSNDLARLVTVGEGRGRMVTWSGRLAKAKVAGSNPVFRSK